MRFVLVAHKMKYFNTRVYPKASGLSR